MTTLLLCFIPFYGLYWMFFKVLPEIKAFLGKSDDEINPMKELLLGFITCGIFYWLLQLKLGRWIQEGQARAGRPNPEDKGVLFLITAFFYVNPFMVQTELNKIWDPSLP